MGGTSSYLVASCLDYRRYEHAIQSKNHETKQIYYLNQILETNNHHTKPPPRTFPPLKPLPSSQKKSTSIPPPFIQFAERAALIRQQHARVLEFLQHAVLQDGDFVEVDYCVQFVGYGDDGVAAEFLADNALDHGVGDVVHAERVEVVSVGVWIGLERIGWRGEGGRRERGRGL